MLKRSCPLQNCNSSIVVIQFHHIKEKKKQKTKHFRVSTVALVMNLAQSVKRNILLRKVSIINLLFFFSSERPTALSFINYEENFWI